MFCSNCGSKVSDTANFCSNCGFNLQKNFENTSEDIHSNKNDSIAQNSVYTFTEYKKDILAFISGEAWLQLFNAHSLLLDIIDIQKDHEYDDEDDPSCFTDQVNLLADYNYTTLKDDLDYNDFYELANKIRVILNLDIIYHDDTNELSSLTLQDDYVKEVASNLQCRASQELSDSYSLLTSAVSYFKGKKEAYAKVINSDFFSFDNLSKYAKYFVGGANIAANPWVGIPTFIGNILSDRKKDSDDSSFLNVLGDQYDIVIDNLNKINEKRNDFIMYTQQYLSSVASKLLEQKHNALVKLFSADESKISNYYKETIDSFINECQEEQQNKDDSQFCSTIYDFAKEEGISKYLKHSIESLNQDEVNKKLLSACKSGNLQEAKDVIDEVADINMELYYNENNSGETFLMIASANGNRDLVHFLIAHGANVNAVANDKYKKTALMYAAYKGYTGIMELLLLNGAKMDMTNARGETALKIAENSFKREAVELLKIWGKNSSVLANNSEKYDSECSTVRDNKHSRESHNSDEANKKLLSACKSGNLQEAKDVINEVADINMELYYNENNSGETFLMIASANGNRDLVHFLIAHGANVNAVANDKYKKTALMYAASKGYTGIMELLLLNGAKMDMTNSRGETALKIAENSFKREVVELLKSWGKNNSVLANNSEKYDSECSTVRGNKHSRESRNSDEANKKLLSACKSGNLQEAKEVIDEITDINMELYYNENNSGETFLMIASANGNRDLVHFLIAHGANVNAVANDKYKKTALMYAASKGYTGIMELLLLNGAKMDMTNARGETALKIAENSFKREAVELLKIWGKNSSASANNSEKCVTVTYNYIITIDQSRCIGCSDCIDICPAGVFELRNNLSYPANYVKCIGCKACVGVCAKAAIDIN